MSKLTYIEKLRIIRNWSSDFEFVTVPHCTGLTGRVTLDGVFEMTCDTKEEVINSMFKAVGNHVYWKVRHTAWKRRKQKRAQR